MARPTTAHRRYLDQQAARAGGLPGADLPWLARLRRDGVERFADLGFPGPKVEEWKYTNLRDLEKVAFEPAPRAANGYRADELAPLAPTGHRLGFVNGRYRPDLSAAGPLPEGVEIKSLAAALEDGDPWIEGRLGAAGALDGLPLLALNTAFIEDGVVLRLGPGTVLDAPIEIVFASGAAGRPVVCQPRNLIVAEADSRATVVERHVAAAPGVHFANAATEIIVEAGAAVRHYRVQEAGAEAFNLATTQVRVGAGALYESFALATGGRLSRDEVRVRLDAPGARCRLDGAYLMRGRQHVDNTTLIDHAEPNTESREIYKGVLDGDSRAVFQGAILVRPGAQGVDGHQINRTLLLSDGAEIDSKPQLEIYADDVKCGHGATAGEIDADALFYLRSRGIDEAAARGLLVEAFLADLIDGLGEAGLREPVRAIVAGWMGADAAGGRP